MMTDHDKHWHGIYQKLPDGIRGIIDSATNEVRQEILSEGYSVDNCDGAECLVAAITRYLVVSNPGMVTFVPKEA